MTIEYGDTERKAELGDTVELQEQECEVVASEVSGKLMLNIDANELQPGDLTFIKQLGLTISNPDTDKKVAVDEDYEHGSFGHTIASFLGGVAADRAMDDTHDDSSFFSGGSFGGGSSFGGFGGGGFSGGGASGGF